MSFSLSFLVLTVLVFAFIPAAIVGGLVSLIHHDLGIYVGIFTWGYSVSVILDTLGGDSPE